MATFSHFDPKTFEKCLKYVQDSIHWLADEQHFLRVHSMVSSDTLTKTANTLQSLLCKVWRFQNSLAPVNRLPPEILSEIFLFVQGDTPPILPTTELPPPSDPSYHQFNLVCRQWHQTIHNNPAFWSRIDLTYHTSHEKVSSLLSRSGAMPLTVYVDYGMFFLKSVSERPQDRDVASQASRFRDLRMINADVDYLTSFIRQASQLEVIVIKKSWNDDDDDDDDDDDEGLVCTFPRLRVLSAIGTALWQSWCTGNLRYINLGGAEWQEDSVISMLSLFRKNPRVEELILWNIAIDDDDWDEINTAVEEHLPLSLPGLKRLLIQEAVSQDDPQRSSMSGIISRMDLPRGCARRFCLAGGDALTAFESGNYGSSDFPVTSLFLDEDSVVGTDKVSSWAICQGIYDILLLVCISNKDIRELWLSKCNASYQDPCLFWDSSGEHPEVTMPNLTKVVLLQMVAFWLLKISSFHFGHFLELQLHTQTYEDEERIVGFIAARKKAGYMIRTLRFVRETSARYDCESFNGWKSDPSKFAEHVGEVIFEERQCDGMDANSFQFELPDVCSTASSVFSEWMPWETFMR